MHYSVFFDAKGKDVATGHRVSIYNSGNIFHNAVLQDADAKYGNVFSYEGIPPGIKKRDLILKYQPRPLSLSCSIHPWMKAYIWVFNHPYAVRTNEKGEFTLKNLPTGVDLQLVCWHPVVGFFGEGEAAGRAMNFKSGRTTLEVPISPR